MVSVLVTLVSPAKTAEPQVSHFGRQTHLGQGIMYYLGCPLAPAVEFDGSIYLAAAIWPAATATVATGSYRHQINQVVEVVMF